MIHKRHISKGFWQLTIDLKFFIIQFSFKKRGAIDSFCSMHYNYDNDCEICNPGLGIVERAKKEKPYYIGNA